MIEYNLKNYNINITNEVNKITDLVYKNKGKTYGGYVRDYLINLDNLNINIEYINNLNRNIRGIILNYSNNSDFNDIDIWFKKEHHYNNFINKLKKLYNINQINMEPVNKYYPVDVYRFMIYDKNKPRFTKYTSGLSFFKSNYDRYDKIDLGYVLFIDICVSDIFPVNDFTINLLSFNGNRFNHSCEVDKFNLYKFKNEEYMRKDHNPKYSEYFIKPYTLSEIKTHIKNKELILLSDFENIDKCKDKMFATYTSLKIERYKKFLQRGYVLKR